MKKFVFEYYGGATPQDLDQEQMKASMDAWGAWFGANKDVMVDSGNPFAPNGMSVTSAGAQTIAADMWPAKGYSIINAEDMDAAVKIAQTCPVLSEGNNPLMRVYEALPM